MGASNSGKSGRVMLAIFMVERAKVLTMGCPSPNNPFIGSAAVDKDPIQIGILAI
jgi:hypothetical protein